MAVDQTLPAAPLPAYEKPLLEEQSGMVFPEEVFQEFNDKHWCFGCTNCNCS